MMSAETALDRKPGGYASRRRRSLCRSVVSVADRPVDSVALLRRDDRQSGLPLREVKRGRD